MQPSGPVPKVPRAVASGSWARTRFRCRRIAAEALQAWAQVIDYLEEQRKISLRGYFEFARVLKWTATELELGFAADDDSQWAGENAAEKPNIDELRGDACAISATRSRCRYGCSTRRRPRRCARARSSSRRARSQVRGAHQARDEAREHPITKHVLQTFGAQIKEIKTDV